jgi:hypothetical protein
MTEFVRRATFPEGFAIIPQTVFKTEGMSYGAIGLHCYLLSLPHDWVVRDTQLMKKGGLGRDAFRKIVKELEVFGWLHITRKRAPDARGRWVWTAKQYVIYDLPRPQPLISTAGNPSTEIPQLTKN